MTQKGSLLPLESLAFRSAAPTTNTSRVAREGLRVSDKAQQQIRMQMTVTAMVTDDSHNDSDSFVVYN